MPQSINLDQLYLSLLTHDGMTSLANIQICAEMLGDDQSLSPTQEQLIQSIFLSQKMLTFSMQNALDAEKVGSGQLLPYLPIATNLTAVARDVCGWLTDEARSRTIMLQVPGNAPTDELFLVDPLRVERLLWNVLSYLCRSTAVGHTVSLNIGKSEDRTHLQLDFCSTELRSSEMVADIEQYMTFLPQTSTEMEHYNSRALGLFVAAQIVRQRSGTIEITQDVPHFQIRMSMPL